jgi:hypothetical protein
VPLLPFGTGCATDLPEEDATPVDGGLGAATAGAQLTSLSYQSIPDTRPYSTERVLGGKLAVAARFQGNGWELRFAAADSTSSDDAQVIQSSSSATNAWKELSMTWDTTAFTTTEKAGSDPGASDLLTLSLTSHGNGGADEAGLDALDAIQVKVDNTPPIALITRICRDAQGSDCFGFTPNPADVGASNSASDLYQVSRSATPRLYVFGIARDKNFTGYSMGMVGGEATGGYYLCSGARENNAGCVGDLSKTPDEFGYGLARDLEYKETLAGAKLVDAYSDDALLLSWDISYLTPDAYALSLNVGSSAYVSGDDDPYTSASWITMLITQ